MIRYEKFTRIADNKTFYIAEHPDGYKWLCNDKKIELKTMKYVRNFNERFIKNENKK